jgi:hypothetical protein
VCIWCMHTWAVSWAKRQALVAGKRGPLSGMLACHLPAHVDSRKIDRYQAARKAGDQSPCQNSRFGPSFLSSAWLLPKQRQEPSSREGRESQSNNYILLSPFSPATQKVTFKTRETGVCLCPCPCGDKALPGLIPRLQGRAVTSGWLLLDPGL